VSEAQHLAPLHVDNCSPRLSALGTPIRYIRRDGRLAFSAPKLPNRYRQDREVHVSMVTNLWQACAIGQGSCRRTGGLPQRQQAPSARNIFLEACMEYAVNTHPSDPVNRGQK
jgi:hypothetical protein